MQRLVDCGAVAHGKSVVGSRFCDKYGSLGIGRRSIEHPLLSGPICRVPFAKTLVTAQMDLIGRAY